MGRVEFKERNLNDRDRKRGVINYSTISGDDIFESSKKSSSYEWFVLEIHKVLFLTKFINYQGLA